MEEILNKLIEKIENNTISLKDFVDIINEEHVENTIKFIKDLCQNSVIDKYLQSFFQNNKYTEDELINKYGEEYSSILISYGIVKDLIKEENIELSDEISNSMNSTDLFFNDIKSIETLSKEVTLEYVSKYQYYVSINDLENSIYYQNKIIEGNIRLVIYVAKKLTYTEIPMLELIDEGVFGLKRAIDYFDTSYNSAFSTYAIYWIRQRMQRYIANTRRGIRVPVHLQNKVSKYLDAKKKYFEKYNKEADISDIAGMLNESEETIIALIKSLEDIESLDKEVKEEGDTDLYNFIETGRFEDGVINKETIKKLMSCLSKKEQNIIYERYFLEKTLNEVGLEYGVTRERVRQMEARALIKMRTYFNMNKNKKEPEKIINNTIDLTNKRLDDILGEELFLKINYYFKKIPGYKTIAYKAFGKNLNEVFNETELSNEEYNLLIAFIEKIIRKSEYQGIGSSLMNKTFIEIINDSVMNLNLEEAKIEKNRFWERHKRKEDNIYYIFSKAFGSDGNNPCDLRNLTEAEKKKITQTLYSFENALRNRSKDVQERQEYMGHTLSEILSLPYEEAKHYAKTCCSEPKVFELLSKAFGSNFDTKLKRNNFDVKEYARICSKLKGMQNQINNKNEFTFKHLNELINKNTNIIRKYLTQKDIKTLEKAFGPDLKLMFINNVKFSHLKKIINYINLMEIKEEIPEEKKIINRYKNKTLWEILNISENELDNILNNINKTTRTYMILTKVFGNDLKGTYNIDSLDKTDYIMLHNKLKSLKDKQHMVKPYDYSNYYKTIINLTPIEYKLILSLYIIDNKTIEEISFLTNTSVEVITLRIKEGLLFIKGVIEVYNNTFKNNEEIKLIRN